MTQHKDLELFAKNIRIQVLKALGELASAIWAAPCLPQMCWVYSMAA